MTSLGFQFAMAVPSGWVVLGPSMQLAMGIGLIGGAYLLSLGMFLAAIWSTRGLPGGGSPRNRVVAKLYAAGTVLSLAGCGLLVAGLLRAV